MPGSWCAPQRPGPVTTSAVAGVECCFSFASSRWLRAVALHCATATLGMSSNVTATLKSRDWACATVLHARLRSKAFLIVSEYSPLYIAATRRRCFALSAGFFVTTIRTRMRRDYHRWYSPSLGRDMELLVFGHAGARVLVFPTSLGKYYEWEDRGMVATLG